MWSAKGRRKEQRYQGPSRNYTTFFFSSFPNSYGEYDMLKIFQWWRRVEEVFISQKLNRWNMRFVFVHFYDVKNARQLEKELDRIHTGNMKHHVNLTRYRRSETNPSQDDREKAKSVVSEHRYKQVWREKGRKSSYVEAVRGASSSKSQDT